MREFKIASMNLSQQEKIEHVQHTDNSDVLIREMIDSNPIKLNGLGELDELMKNTTDNSRKKPSEKVQRIQGGKAQRSRSQSALG